MVKMRYRVFCTVALILGSPLAGTAAELFGRSGRSHYQIDPSTGEPIGTPFGSNDGFAGNDDLANGLPGGRGFWAIEQRNRDERQLVHFSSRGDVLHRVTVNSQDPILTLATDPATGTIYGGSNSYLYSIDPASGDAAIVGAVAVPLDSGLTMGPNGRLFGVSGGFFGSELVSVSSSTGSATPLATFEAVGFGDIAFSPETGELFGIGPFMGDYSLISIDLRGNEVSQIGPTMIRGSGLAFSTVPEPAGWPVWVAMSFGVLPRLRLRRKFAC